MAVQALLMNGFGVLECRWMPPRVILPEAIMSAKKVIDYIYD